MLSKAVLPGLCHAQEGQSHRVQEHVECFHDWVHRVHSILSLSHMDRELHRTHVVNVACGVPHFKLDFSTIHHGSESQLVVAGTASPEASQIFIFVMVGG